MVIPPNIQLFTFASVLPSYCWGQESVIDFMVEGMREGLNVYGSFMERAAATCELNCWSFEVVLVRYILLWSLTSQHR